MPNQPTQIGRLAFRHEGENWNTYYALKDSMADAIFLGSIAMGAIINNSERKEEFMSLMRSIVSDILKAKTGHAPTWGGITTAPQHEKAGHS